MNGEQLDNDLGLDLLMNPRKKSGDNMSIISSLSAHSRRSERHANDYEQEHSSIHDSDVSSLKSIKVKPEVVHIREPSVIDDEDFDESESISVGTSEESGSYVSRSRGGSREASLVDAKVHRRPSYVSEEEIINAKREYLYQFDRLEKKGIRLPRKFTMASSLEDMKQELDRLKKDREIDNSIKFQRKTMITVVSGIELLNSFFNTGAKLDGWSEHVNEGIDDYDDIFEELHEKYKGKAKIAPEIKLLFMLGGSAFMFHTTRYMAKSSSIPGMEDVLRQNPELAKQFAAATAKTMASQNAQSAGGGMMGGLGGILGSMLGGGGGGLGGMLGSMFGGAGASAPQRQQSAPMPPPQNMKGPSNVDDILRDLDMTDNDRIEVLSTVSGSEMTDFADDTSINNLLMNKKKGRRQMNLDL